MIWTWNKTIKSKKEEKDERSHVKSRIGEKMGVEKHINTSSIFEAIIQCQQNKKKKVEAMWNYLMLLKYVLTHAYLKQHILTQPTMREVIGWCLETMLKTKDCWKVL